MTSRWWQVGDDHAVRVSFVDVPGRLSVFPKGSAVKKFGKLVDRLVTRLVPPARAEARCPYESYCFWDADCPNHGRIWDNARVCYRLEPSTHCC